MPAQPQQQRSVAEIDFREILAASETNAPVRSNSAIGGAEFIQPYLSRDTLLRSYEAMRIGRSGWVNVIFATLMSIGGLFCTLRFFDVPDSVRMARSSEREYLYARPADVSPSSRSIQSGQSSPQMSNGPGNSPNSNSPRGPGQNNAGNPNRLLPSNPNSMMPQSSQRPSGNSQGGRQTAANRASTASKSASQQKSSSKSRRQTGGSAKRIARVREASKSGNVSAQTKRVAANCSATSVAKPNQNSNMRPINNVSRPVMPPTRLMSVSSMGQMHGGGAHSAGGRH
jgi:anti-sigma28 factor (negative regulator of flagellin synthesis)